MTVKIIAQRCYLQHIVPAGICLTRCAQASPCIVDFRVHGLSHCNPVLNIYYHHYYSYYYHYHYYFDMLLLQLLLPLLTMIAFTASAATTTAAVTIFELT